MHDDDSRAMVLDGAEASRSAPPIGPNWLLQAKVVPPAVVDGYVRRTSLEARLEGLGERRFTVLRSPAGFGKTTLLADLCRRKKIDGMAVGWFSLDEDDTPDLFVCYLARSLQHAGLDLTLIDEDAWSSLGFLRQLGMLAHAIEAHAAPCLLALDEVERLPSSSVDLLDRLLKRSPRNLHTVLAFRKNPGLDLLPCLLNGSGSMIEAEHFRFSRTDIRRFHGGSLSLRATEAVERRTAGWPVAVMVDRNAAKDTPAPHPTDFEGYSANFIGMRLLGGISDDDRAHLFDLAIFDWIRAELVDEVLGSSTARLRILSLPALDGPAAPD